MTRFFLDPSAISGHDVDIHGPLARHLSASRRIKAGEEILALDARDEIGVRIESASIGHVKGKILWRHTAGGEPQLNCTVLHALIREFDDVVASLVHTGAKTIVPVAMERSMVNLNQQQAAKKVERWQTIAKEAAQLAHRGEIPEIKPPAPLESALAGLPAGTRIVACVIGAQQPLSRLEISAGRPLALIIGPEGDFAPAEYEVLRRHNAEMVQMGARVLPSRSAGSIALTLALRQSGDLDQPMPHSQ